MKRYLTESIDKDLPKKVVLLSGPRQVGKTTLAKSVTAKATYLNFDIPEDRLVIQRRQWQRSTPLLILDELHKMQRWKSFLKGIYDASPGIPPILVTGSARLDTFRKVGDSLAGRFFAYRLHPIDVQEAAALMPPEEALERILRVGGFPEPFLDGSDEFSGRWRRTHLDAILRQDLLDLETVRDIQSIETLVVLLRTRVGAPVSYANLARDLERDAKTIKRWLTVLENLYVIFRVTPYSKKIARAILKEPKYYFFDSGAVRGDEGARFENVVATSLLKKIHYLQDVHGRDLSLHFIRNKERQEVDFLICRDGTPALAIECKWSDPEPSRSFRGFSKAVATIDRIQLVRTLDRDLEDPKTGVQIRRAATWLASVPL